MARSDITNEVSLLAGAAITQYSVVKHASTAGEVVTVSATTDTAIGICQNDPADGEVARVALAGSIAIGIAGTSNLNEGELLGFDTTGRLVDHTTDGRLVLAQAIDPSSATGDYVQVNILGLYGYS